MSRESVLILFGLLVAFSPFSGLPISWLAWILPILGATVLVIGVSFKAQKILAVPVTEHEQDS